MVKGIETFKEYFKDHTDKYVIIGGTACDMIISQEGLTPRATKGIDIILIVEALSSEFISQFWQFIKDARYKRNEESNEDKKYYRFTEPEEGNFPYQVELFSRKPDVITLNESVHITPIPADDGLSSLSAILMIDEYYNYMVKNSIVENGLHVATKDSVICLKAKAYLEMTARKAAGSHEDEKHIKKHKADVFRLGALLSDEDQFELPAGIQQNMQVFFETIEGDLPDKAIMKAMGAPVSDMQKLYKQLLKNFNVELGQYVQS
jgi:hypothetical protein